MSSSLLIQLIGLCAVVIAFLIFQTNNRTIMLKLSMAAGALWTIHFLLLGAMTGAAMNFIGVGRSYVFYKVKPSIEYALGIGIISGHCISLHSDYLARVVKLIAYGRCYAWRYCLSTERPENDSSLVFGGASPLVYL